MTENVNWNDWVGLATYQNREVAKGLTALDLIEKIPTTYLGLFCLAADEYIYTANGVKKAGELEAGDELHNGNKVTSNFMADDELYEITFSNGIKVQCNGNHQVYWKRHRTCDTDRGFKKVKDIADGIGCYRNSKGSVYFEPAEDFGPDLKAAKLIGYLSSDGYITAANKSKGYQSIKFTNNNETFLSEVELLAHEEFGIIGKRYAKNDGYDILLTHRPGTPNPILNYIRELGITSDSYGSVLSANQESLKEFVRGFFNGDGYLLLRHRTNGYSKLDSIDVGFCIGSSLNRAIEFQYILWKLGIYSRISHEKRREWYQIFYRVVVSSFDAKRIIDILDHSKYPEKFERALKAISLNSYMNHYHREWMKIRNISKIGTGQVAVITTQTGEFISYCGMKNHNCGNQFGKDFHISGLYLFKMICGMLPIERFNMRPADTVRTIRLAANNLPTDKDAEVSNPVYPIIKKIFPKSWIKKDITARNTVMTIKDPQGGKDIFFEFVSYSQDTLATAGVQRKLIICSELPPYAFWEEQKPRLLAAAGRMILCLTSTEANYMYDEMFENARVIVRTPVVVEAYKKYLGMDVKKVTKTDSPHDIGVFQAATDDNPIWMDVIERQNLNMTMDEYISSYIVGADPDLVPMRRYGIMKQIGGAIFKDFSWDIHWVSKAQYFPSGIPHEWRHGRFVDYHESNKMAYIAIALSPQNEAFVWQEMEPDPSANSLLPICEAISSAYGDYKSSLDLMDPLASKNQPSISRSAMQDMNRIFLELKRQGRGTGAFWQSWDTRSTKGRDAVIERLQNAKLVGTPFNNKVVKNGRTVVLPTLWILDTCKQTALSLKNWRMVDHKDQNAKVEKDPSEKPQQKWSHFCMCLEAAFKHPAFLTPPREEKQPERHVPQAMYGRR